MATIKADCKTTEKMTFSEVYASVGEVTKYSLRRVNALTDSVIVAKGAITADILKLVARQQPRFQKRNQITY